jgi:chemotaxis methyl-accepting protein methylase
MTKAALLNKKYTYQEKIELIHPDFKTLLSKNSGFQVQNYNLFDEIQGKYVVIRAMNILHQGYFNNDQLFLILNNIYNGLEMGGLLIEGSNENEGTPVEGAIYKKDEKGFFLLIEPEKPSRIKEIILAFSYNN